MQQLLSLIALSAAVHAASFEVKVGQGGNVFEPSTITAQVGDQVVFTWTGSKHSVVESTYDAPCSPLAGGFAVSTQSTSDATFTVNVTSTDPLWFYCSVPSHCQGGMVGVINPPTGKTQSDFAAAAQKANSNSQQPSGVIGGVLVAGGSTSVGAAATAAGGSATGTASGASTTGTGPAAQKTGSTMTPEQYKEMMKNGGNTETGQSPGIPGTPPPPSTTAPE